MFICNLLWFVGIHGALIITGIMNPFWMTYLFENQQALAAGSATLPHIYLQGFWDFYLLIGGIGSTLPLVFMAMRSRSRQLKSVGKIGLLPSLFNINEPILFGFSDYHEPGLSAAVSVCAADKCLYRLVFNPTGDSRSGGGDAAVVDAGAARRGVVSQRQLEKLMHVPVCHF
ncbi:PEP-dependent phosphotransferase enzyme II [Klebsiella grimontii]|uniref:PEP-dependent phosphotransferase enzyme II n=1 Tax=Klebsiella grimontii TaxID=2058152 RepID=A0A7H4NY44_9ENTR|nr:PEP-dependent phosphotransferase enzyme II [Klebsiella grimontii]